MKGSVIVFDAITVARQTGFAFDTWYVNHYLPMAWGQGKYLSVQCYGSPLRATYLALWEAAAATTTNQLIPDASHDSIIEVERYVGEAIGQRQAANAPPNILDAAFLYPVLFNVPLEREDEFNAWYKEEHMAILLRSPYWPMCRRFRIMNRSENSFTHIALHYLIDLKALESAERTEARNTPWRARLAAEPWFSGDYRVYYRYGQRQCLGVSNNGSHR